MIFMARSLKWYKVRRKPVFTNTQFLHSKHGSDPQNIRKCCVAKIGNYTSDQQKVSGICAAKAHSIYGMEVRVR